MEVRIRFFSGEKFRSELNKGAVCRSMTTMRAPSQLRRRQRWRKRRTRVVVRTPAPAEPAWPGPAPLAAAPHRTALRGGGRTALAEVQTDVITWNEAEPLRQSPIPTSTPDALPRPPQF